MKERLKTTGFIIYQFLVLLLCAMIGVIVIVSFIWYFYWLILGRNVLTDIGDIFDKLTDF